MQPDDRARGGRDSLSRVSRIIHAAVDKTLQDDLTMWSAAIAFYGMLSLVPALFAVVSIYGVFADRADVHQQVELVASLMPPSAAELLRAQLEAVVARPLGELGVGLFISLGAMLWSASSAMSTLMQGVDLAHHRRAMRNAINRRAIALTMTLGSIGLLAIAIVAVGVVPALLRFLQLSGLAELLIDLGRWPVLAIVVVVGLRALYRHSPLRVRGRRPAAMPGIALAVVCCLATSVGLSLYVEYFGRFSELYGALGGVVLLLLWLWLGALSVLLGAELNAAVERQRSATADVRPAPRLAPAPDA